MVRPERPVAGLHFFLRQLDCQRKNDLVPGIPIARGNRRIPHQEAPPGTQDAEHLAKNLRVFRRFDVHEHEKRGRRIEARIEKLQIARIHHDLQRSRRRLLQFPLDNVDRDDL
jgi:hypothetical protein